MVQKHRAYTEEMKAEIAKLWNEGWTGSEIAAEYGMSRNSVIGMANRNRDLFITKPPPPALVKVVAKRREKKAKRERAKHMERNTIEAPAMDPPAPVYTLMDLGPRNCRWPINGGDPYLFCGAITEVAQNVYCACHKKIATVATVYRPRKSPLVFT